MASVGRGVVRSGLVVGSGGNISARLPGTDQFWVTAAGSWLDCLDDSQLCAVRLATGSVVSGARSPTTELALHLATYRVRPEINAIVHLHPQQAILLTALGERIRLVTTDHAFYLRRIAVTPFASPGTERLARIAAEATVDGTNCVILAHHGCSVLGETLELAYKRALYLEEAARLSYAALVAGRLGDLPECPAEFWDRLTSGGQVSA